ncbi:MAG: trigger factor [Verrucomicrobia bacterium]|jgi:trigger factor|nr:trigger factor [Verrucomicrobiota bacterium]
MKVSVEKQPHCLATLRATVPAGLVQKKVEKLAGEYQRSAKLPGFRPGKAPVAVVARKYKDAIAEEAVKELLREAVDQGAKDNDLTVLNAFNLRHGEVGSADLDLSIDLTLEPDFKMPDVETFGLEVLEEVVTDEHVKGNIDMLLERMAEFTDIKDRPLQMGDYAVLDYDATVEGKPLGEVCPEAPSTMKGGEGLWVIMEEESMWPGFCAGLVGAKEGEDRTVEVTVPEDFAVPPLRGKKITHETKIRGIKSKKLPALTDEVAQKMAGRTADELRAAFRQRLESAASEQTERKKRAAVVEHLVKSVEFEVPASMVMGEARRVVREIVEAEQMRGLSDEDLLSKKEEIFQHAQMGAQFRVKADFILTRLAREQKIQATREELTEHIASMAQRLSMPMDKLVKQLVKREALGSVEGEVVRDKALDFLASKVKVKPAGAMT